MAMNGIIYLIISLVSAGYFWFSLHPGTFFGCVVSPADWTRIFRNLDDRKLQAKSSLRSAGHRSILFHLALVGLGVSSGAGVGNYSVTAAFLAFGAFSTGFAVGYFLLLWSTREGGWYGLA